MYMPGRRRTASRPSRTWMSFALYDAGTFVPLASPRAVFTSSFLTATCSPLCLSGANEHLVETLEVFVVVELDLDATAATPAKDLHLRAQRGTELVRHLRKVGIATQHARARARRPVGWTILRTSASASRTESSRARISPSAVMASESGSGSSARRCPSL